jgi:hypothetical protein
MNNHIRLHEYYGKYEYKPRPSAIELLAKFPVKKSKYKAGKRKK